MKTSFLLKKVTIWRKQRQKMGSHRLRLHDDNLKCHCEEPFNATRLGLWIATDAAHLRDDEGGGMAIRDDKMSGLRDRLP